MMHDRKVAFILPSLGKGGAERAVINLSEYMAVHLKAHVTIVKLYNDDNEYTPSPLVRVICLQLKKPPYSFLQVPFIFLSRVIHLRSLFKIEKFDTIYSVMDPINFSVILTGFQIISSSHHSVEFVSRFYKIFFWLYNRNNVLKHVVLTSKMQNDFRRMGVKNTLIIPNPVVLNVSNSEASISSEIMAYINSSRYYLAVGRLDPVKNFNFLIQAFASAACSKHTKLLIAGEGKDRSHLEKLILSLNLAGQVILLGSQNDEALDCLYKNAYATVLTSYTEAYPTVLIESLMRGTPVISVNCPDGPAEIVSHGENGLLIFPENLEEMRDALDRLVYQQDLREKFAKNGVKSIDCMDVKSVVDLWMQINR